MLEEKLLIIIPASKIGLLPEFVNVAFICIILFDWFKSETEASKGESAAEEVYFVVKLIVVEFVLLSLSIAANVIWKLDSDAGAVKLQR